MRPDGAVGGRLRPSPRGLPWRRAAALTGLLLTLAAGVRAVGIEAARPVAVLPAAAAGTSNEGGRPVLLYLFQGADCARHRELQRRWSELGRSGLVEVVGVPLDPLLPESQGPDGAPADALPGGRSDPGFPVRPDLRRTAGRLMARLGYRTTPVSILLDGRGRARLVVPPPPKDRAAAAEAAVRASLEAM